MATVVPPEAKRSYARTDIKEDIVALKASRSTKIFCFGLLYLPVGGILRDGRP